MMVIPKWNTSAAKALLKTKHLPARLEVVPLPTAVSTAFFRSLLGSGERLFDSLYIVLPRLLTGDLLR